MEGLWLDHLRIWECRWAKEAQNLLEPYGSFFTESAHFGHPNVPYIILFPFFFLFSRQLSLKVLWTVTLCEYLNTIFKWLFNDHRPYWWVKELHHDPNHQHHLVNEPLDLAQFPETCETGPGFPSGHVMITTCVWVLIITELKKVCSKTLIRIFSTFVFFYAFIIAIGRIYISAHFPDQVIAGALFGIYSWWYIKKRTKYEIMNLRRFAITSVVSFAGALFLNKSLAWLNFNPNWTLAMAKKHCFDPMYAKADSTPMFVIWKSAGTMMGTGIAFDLLPRITGVPSLAQRSKLLRLIGSVFLVLICQFLMGYVTPNPSNLNNVLHFYAYSYAQYMLMPVMVHFIALLIAKVIKTLF